MLDYQEGLTSRTTTDVVFDQLHGEIVSLTLLPGTKISEVETANRLGVSRQPVRDAFNRLGNLGLLSVRPQRATLVRGFSKSKISNVRFIRLAIELEVIRDACAVWNDAYAETLEKNLNEQRLAIQNADIPEFHSLDYKFHQLICVSSGHSLAFETILNCKKHVDRLCVLSLARSEEVSAVLVGHEEIADALRRRSVDNACALIRTHLSRLDEAIIEIQENHSEYFEQD